MALFRLPRSGVVQGARTSGWSGLAGGGGGTQDTAFPFTRREQRGGESGAAHQLISISIYSICRFGLTLYVAVEERVG